MTNCNLFIYAGPADNRGEGRICQNKQSIKSRSQVEFLTCSCWRNHETRVINVSSAVDLWRYRYRYWLSTVFQLSALHATRTWNERGRDFFANFSEIYN